MRIRRMPTLAGAVLVAVALLAAGCGTDEDAGQEGPTITIGSANFSESVILAHIYGQALEAEGYDVDMKLNVGAREVSFPALERGEIDLMPEYTGALVRFLTKDDGSATPDSDETYSRVSDELRERDLTALPMSDAQDKDSIVVTEATAEEHELEQVSDLAPVASDLVFGGSPECPTRPSCLKGLQDVYGLRFKETKTLDSGGPATVTALETGAVDVTLLFSTDGRIAAKNFVVLEDDKGIEAAQNIFAVASDELVDAYGREFVDLIGSINEELTTEALTDMNKRADLDKDDPEQIAADWLEEHDVSA